MLRLTGMLAGLDNTDCFLPFNFLNIYFRESSLKSKL
jgi:hypothetical protein